MKKLKLIILLVIGYTSFSQSVPAPGEEQSRPIVFENATIHIGNGQVINNGSILFSDGKIKQVGQVTTPANAIVKDVSGKRIYPGLIAPNTIIGLAEIEALRQTKDYDEIGENNANIRSIIAYNTDSRVTPTVRSNGILIAQVAPRGGTISGTSSVVQLDAWNWEDAAIKLDDGLYMNWPNATTYSGWWAEPGGMKKNKNFNKKLVEIRDYFAEAKAYYMKPYQSKNLRFEGMKGLFNGKKKLFIRADEAKEIVSAVEFAKHYNIKPVIVGGAESHTIVQFLKENNVPVVLQGTHTLPNHEDDDLEHAYELPKILQDAGVNYCLSYLDFWQVRNLPFQAGTAAAYGLTKEQALQAITLNSAKILGIADKVGSLEVGKDATLIVVEGDVLDMATSNVVDAYINGRQINLTNKQKELYEKFGTKYNQEIVLPSQK